MPLWFARLGLLRPLLPYLAILAGAVALWYVVDARAYQRGQESRQPEIIKLQTDNATLASNNLVLSSSIDVQNRAVEQLRTEATQRAKEGAAALSAARKANEGLAATAEALRKSGKVPRNLGAPCAISGALAGVKL